MLSLRSVIKVLLLFSNLHLTYEAEVRKKVTRSQAKQEYHYVKVAMSHLEISHINVTDKSMINTKSERPNTKNEEIVKVKDPPHARDGNNDKTKAVLKETSEIIPDKQTVISKPPKVENIDVHQHPQHVVEHAKHHHRAKQPHHDKTHSQWYARANSINQFVYEITGLQQCFYQYVLRHHTLVILYQSLERYPFPIYLEHSDGETECNNAKFLSGKFKAQARRSGHFRLCVDNIGWGTNRIFLSIRVEKNKTMLHRGANGHGGDILREILALEMSLHRTSALVKQQSAFKARRNNFQESERNCIVWMTWASLVVALCTYLMQVMETHRLFDQAAAMTTFTMNGGEFKMGKSMV